LAALPKAPPGVTLARESMKAQEQLRAPGVKHMHEARIHTQQKTSHETALVLIVDPQVETRHWLWRLLSSAFGVIEAKNALAARRWIDERPDIDALIIDDELPDARGSDLVRELARSHHPIAQRSIVVASEWRRVMLGGLEVVDRGDVSGIVQRLTTWFRVRDIGAAAWRRLPGRG
jgi:CheY-like chemotaxis protein